MDAGRHLCEQECEDMAARCEADKQQVSDQNLQALMATFESQKLAIDFKKKLKQVEKQINERDGLIFDLMKERDDISQRLAELSDQLRSKMSELMAEKQQRWQTEVKEMEVEKRRQGDKEEKAEMK